MNLYTIFYFFIIKNKRKSVRIGIDFPVSILMEIVEVQDTQATYISVLKVYFKLISNINTY